MLSFSVFRVFCGKNPQFLLTSPSLTYLLYRLWGHISSRRRAQLFFLLILIILASFAEVISLGAVVPFLGVLTDPERVVTGSLALALPIETKN